MSKIVLNKRSNAIVDDAPKSPTSDQLQYGEIAVNYSEGNETIFLKNDNNEVVGLPFKNMDAEVIQEVTTQLMAHANRNDNPHQVTKEQVGLGNVENVADVDRAISTAQLAAINAKIDKTAIVDNVTTNDSTKPLSAAQGVVLLERANALSGGTAQDLDKLNSRISSVEEELEGTVEQADQIKTRIELMTNTECVEIL